MEYEDQPPMDIYNFIPGGGNSTITLTLGNHISLLDPSRLSHSQKRDSMNIVGPPPINLYTDSSWSLNSRNIAGKDAMKYVQLNGTMTTGHLSSLYSPKSTFNHFDKHLFQLQSCTNLRLPEQSFNTYLAKTNEQSKLLLSQSS